MIIFILFLIVKVVGYQLVFRWTKLEHGSDSIHHVFLGVHVLGQQESQNHIF